MNLGSVWLHNALLGSLTVSIDTQHFHDQFTYKVNSFLLSYLTIKCSNCANRQSYFLDIPVKKPPWTPLSSPCDPCYPLTVSGLPGSGLIQSRAHLGPSGAEVIKAPVSWWAPWHQQKRWIRSCCPELCVHRLSSMLCRFHLGPVCPALMLSFLD